ncbi:MAG: hypothetical protein H6555_00155 [Lewinellaceae bacterium]|nr:hypothetical protein [Lewinellaceae bacterium]
MYRYLGILFSVLPLLLSAQTQPRSSTQWELAVGTHTYALPGVGGDWARFNPEVFAGWGTSMNSRQTLQLKLRMGFSRGRYQGDALQMQATVGFYPVLGHHWVPGIELGAGYQWSFYPDQGWSYGVEGWENRRGPRGVKQVPLQFSLGYRGTKGRWGQVEPFVAYQLQALLGYSPDLSPLPVSNALIGLRISPTKN